MATKPLSDAELNDTSGFPDEPAAQPEQKPEATPGDTDPDGDDTLELTDDQALDDSAAKPNAEEGADKTDKQENPVEKRIRGALKARDDARNELANEKAEKAELARRLAAIEARMNPTGEEGTTEPDAKAPNPEDYEFGALDQKYIDDSINYRAGLAVKEALGSAEQQFQERQQQQAQIRAQQESLDAAKEIVAKGVALHDDFEEVVWERGLREEYKLDAPTFEALREAEHGAEIVYALASDPTEAARVASLSPTQQAKYVFDKDREFTDAAKPPRAPKAGTPPGQPTRGAGGRYTVAGDTDDLDAFEKEFYSKKK